MRSNHLFRRSESDGVVTKIVDGVPFSQESISKDSERACWRRDILKYISKLSKERDVSSLRFP